MNLQDVIDQLSTAELSNLFAFDDDTQEICEESRRKLVPQLNLGLSLLHSRFFLKEGREVINMEEGIYTYTLQNKDVIRVEQVKDIADNEYLLNVEDDEESLMMHNRNTLKVPPKMEPITLEVIYRAGPEKVKRYESGVDPEYLEVDLPYVYLEPLVYFIASRFLNPMGASEGLHEGNNYAAKYEQACQTLERQNLDINRHSDVGTFDRAGWV